MNRIYYHHYGRKRRNSSGFTLLELLIAMSLGLFLIAALIQVLMANRTVFRVQENMSRTQEDGRFAIVVLNKAVSMSGYREDATKKVSSQFNAYSTSSPSIAFSSGEVIRGSDNNVGVSDGVLDSSDTLAIRFHGSTDNSTRDCLSLVVNSGLIATNHFYINDSNTLTCQSSIFDPTIGSTSTLTRPLIDNVENMQIRYGMNTNGGGSNAASANCYLDAGTTLGAGSDCTTLNYSNVVSARISLTLRSEDDNLVPGATAQTYTFNDATVTATDRRLYRVITTTVAIRNRIL
ncbi:MAG: PilW family protein [Porticoccaceae bacterium]|nr:PilW family protein [Porticoccaceae bacterium]